MLKYLNENYVDDYSILVVFHHNTCRSTDKLCENGIK